MFIWPQQPWVNERQKKRKRGKKIKKKEEIKEQSSGVV